MSHRTQITLTDQQYERLLDESDRTGLGLAELVRRALTRCYGDVTPHERARALRAQAPGRIVTQKARPTWSASAAAWPAASPSGSNPHRYLGLDRPLRGKAGAVDALRSAAERGHRLAASVLTRVEVLAGMRPDEERVTRRLLDVLNWMPVDEAVAEDAGRLANYCLRSHPGIDPVDYVIAATADRMDALLWTGNLKHFPMFPGLRATY